MPAKSPAYALTAHGPRSKRLNWAACLAQKPKNVSLPALRGPDLDAFQAEHPDLGCRASRSRKPANLAAGGQDPVTGNDQRDRISRHGLTNVARSLWPATQLPGEGAIGGRLPPFDTSCRGIDTFEELILSIEIELDLRKIRLVALEVALHGGYRLARHGRSAPPARRLASDAAKCARRPAHSWPEAASVRCLRRSRQRRRSRLWSRR